MWGQKETLQLWEEISEVLMRHKSQMLLGQFPMKDLASSLANIPAANAKWGVACWNLIKTHYGDKIMEASARLVDMHFSALVLDIVMLNCVGC